MRKSDLKKDLETAKANVATANKSIELLIKQHDQMVVHNRELHEMLEHVKAELRLYNWAFSIAAGRLMAHAKTDEPPAAFTEALLDEARKELGITE